MSIGPLATSKSEEDPKSHSCREHSKTVKQDLTKGYNNLISHVTCSHKDDCFERERVACGVANGPMDYERFRQAGDQPKRRKS